MVLADLQWVRGADAACQTAGCQLPEAIRALAAAQQVGEVARRMEIDDVALWCGVGGHAFSGKDPGRQKVRVQQWDDEGQQLPDATVSACGEHARPVQAVTRPKPAALPAPVSVTDPAEAQRRGYDPAYVKWLEQQNGITPTPAADHD